MDDTAAVQPAYFVSDSTGVTAETLGNALLVNFPGVRFARHTVPFVSDEERVRDVVARIERDASAGPTPLVFSTVRNDSLEAILRAAPSTHIDLFSGHLAQLSAALGTTASPQPLHYHSLDDAERYFGRMRAVEYAIEHDDGQSKRGLQQADVIIVAPSRCGKTPTTMYLALQYGLLVANYPLTDDDFPLQGLPPFIAPYASKCFGLTTTPMRLSQVRHERRPDSVYASLAQCTTELRRAEALYRSAGIPSLNSATKSVEEMSAVIIQSLNLRP